MMKRWICFSMAALLMCSSLSAAAQERLTADLRPDAPVVIDATFELPRENAPLLRARRLTLTQAQARAAFPALERVAVTAAESYYELSAYEPAEAQPLDGTDEYAVQFTATEGMILFGDARISMTDGMLLDEAYANLGASGGAMEDFSIDQAARMVTEALTALGVRAGDIEWYARITGERMTKLREQYVVSIDAFTPESREAQLLFQKARRDRLRALPLPEEGYLIRLNARYGAMDCGYCLYADGFAYAPERTCVTAYVTRQGVQRLNASGALYSVEAEKRMEGKRVIPPKKALSAIKKHFSTDTPEAIRLDRIAYQYVATEGKGGAYILHPAWCFGAQDGTTVCVDAYTGKLLG